MLKKFLALFVLLFAVVACTDAQVASENVSRAADQFEVDRRIVFYNGITDTYMFTIEGRCSIESDNYDNQLEVICRTDEGMFFKHFLGKSDNVTYFVEQIGDVNASTTNYRVIFKPEVIVPNFDRP